MCVCVHRFGRARGEQNYGNVMKHDRNERVRTFEEVLLKGSKML